MVGGKLFCGVILCFGQENDINCSMMDFDTVKTRFCCPMNRSKVQMTIAQNSWIESLCLLNSTR